MVRFYDPRDSADLARVEGLLRAEGIEYCLRGGDPRDSGTREVLVAEEDFPRADEVLCRAALH
ncbi:MAG TPA: DUF2007 domain-containing protein [Geobacteraceae bacterium]